MLGTVPGGPEGRRGGHQHGDLPRQARKQGEEGGIMKREAAIAACKVQVVCPKCSKGHPRRPQDRGRQEDPRVQALRR